MRIMIVGQKWLAAETLKLCQSLGHQVVAVAAPAEDDRLYRLAIEQGIPAAVIPRRLEATDIPPGADLVIAAHAWCFITKGAREAASLGALGYHPSLLPRHRGRDAIRWAIHMQEATTGGTAYWMTGRADAGPIAAQDWCHIKPSDTPAELWRRELAPMGIRLFETVLNDLQQGVKVAIEQDEALATWEPSFDRPRLGNAGE